MAGCSSKAGGSAALLAQCRRAEEGGDGLLERKVCPTKIRKEKHLCFFSRLIFCTRLAAARRERARMAATPRLMILKMEVENFKCVRQPCQRCCSL